MANFNKVLLMGNLTRDPQLRYLPNQMAVCDFGLACNRKLADAAGRGPRRGHVRRLHGVGQAGRDHQPVLPEGQADLHRGPAEVRHLGRQAGRRQAQQALGRRRELPVHRRRAMAAGGGAPADSGGEGSQRRPRPSQRRPQPQQPAPAQPAAPQQPRLSPRNSSSKRTIFRSDGRTFVRSGLLNEIAIRSDTPESKRG